MRSREKWWRVTGVRLESGSSVDLGQTGVAALKGIA